MLISEISKEHKKEIESLDRDYQRKAEEQANTVMNKLKEQGIDVDNLSQEDLMQEALKLNANR